MRQHGQDRKFNRGRSSIRRIYGAIADHARPAGAQRPARRRASVDVRTAFPVGARSQRDRSDAPVALPRTPKVPARDRGVGVRLRESGGPRRVVAWRPVQTVPGSREDSARRRGRPSPRGRLRRPVVGQPFQGDDAHRTVAGGTREGVRRIECRALPRDRSCVRQVALVTRAIQTIPQTTLPYGVTVIRRRADSGDAPGFPTSTTTS